MQKAQRGVSLDQDADWASEAHSLIQSWQAAQTQHAGASGSNNPAGKQAGSSKSNPQGRQGQQQTKKQAKKRTRQSQHQQSKQQQQEQPRQQQPKQEQEQPSTSRPQEQTGAASGSENAFKHAPGSAAHGKYSHTHGPQGQPTESAEPWMKDSSAAHHEWLSNGELLRCAWHSMMASMTLG